MVLRKSNHRARLFLSLRHLDDAIADMKKKKRDDVESFSEIDNPLVYEQRVTLHGASLFEVFKKKKKNKEFRGRL